MANRQIGLGVRSDYVVHHLRCEQQETDEYLITRTPANPYFYFGNTLALKVSLVSKSMLQWQALFCECFSGLPEVRHQTFIWVANDDMDEGLIQLFQQDGFLYEQNHVLSAGIEALQRPLAMDSEFVIRAFTEPGDWLQWYDEQMKSLLEQESGGDHQSYLQQRLYEYQLLQQRQYGCQFGVFAGSRLLAYAGVYHLNGLARYQNVWVMPEYRNRGLARNLLFHMAEWVSQFAAQQVIVADANYHATLLYQGLGFQVVEHECSLCRYPC
ncbi:GNAT family N-acetyltransferase [Gynuella sp.]|uniref:GNAT family N-acetyltransferase n=1 Tax=Gynuella sp. TaxID=2969146 RepID=UPI003D152107